MPQQQALRPLAAGRWTDRYGPWAIVTGASDGIGRAFAHSLAEMGFNLVLAARREDVLVDLASELARAHDIEALVIATDLGQPGGVDELVSRTRSLDVGLLIAAAGFGTSGPFVDAQVDSELEMIAVNCVAVAALSHHFGSRFVRRGRGALVLMSSIVAFQGVPRAANYAATKAYVQTLAEGLRSELSPFGVQVIACAPGPVHSGFAHRAHMRLGRAATPEVVARETLRALSGSGTVRPGFLSKLLGWSLALLPRWGRVRLMTRIMGKMTNHRA